MPQNIGRRKRLKPIRRKDGRFSPLTRLVVWLNAAKGTVAYDRVLSIYDLLLESQECAESARLDGERLGECKYLLNRTLIEYGFRLWMSYWPETGWKREFMATKQKKDTFEMVGVDAEGYRYHIVESEAVMNLLRTTEDGGLRHLRLCAHCKERWRISFRAMDRFCGADCRVKYRVSSEENKLRQRANQLSYRRRLKARDEKERSVLSVLRDGGQAGSSKSQKA